jgi:hypothetical protein
MDYGVEAQSGEPYIATLSGAGEADGVGGAEFIGPSKGQADGVGGAVAIPGSAGKADGVGQAMANYGWAGRADGFGGATSPPASVGRADGIGGSTSLPATAEAQQFLARATGLDSKHIIAYTNLINGLVSDAVWPKLDVLYIFATNSQSNALLNLVSSNYTGVANGTPTFTVDRGFTGVDASTTVYIDSTFNPTTATSPHFVTNSCHISAWPHTDPTVTSSGGTLMGVVAGGGGNQTDLYGKYSDGKAYFRINDGTASAGISSSSAIAHWIASRTGASTSTGYQNGSSVTTPNAAAGTLVNVPIPILAYIAATGLGPGGAYQGGTGCQLLMSSIGGGLTATDAANFYNRLSTYMSAIVGMHLRATQTTQQVLEAQVNNMHMRSTQATIQVLHSVP